MPRLAFFWKGMQDIYGGSETYRVYCPEGIAVVTRDDFQNVTSKTSEMLDFAMSQPDLGLIKRIADDAPYGLRECHEIGPT